MIYIFWTCATEQEAQKIAQGLIEKRLIACASIIPNVTSVYRWEGKVETAKEVKVILKTRIKHFSKVKEQILISCSYDVPEIASIKVDQVHSDYLKWLEEETKRI